MIDWRRRKSRILRIGRENAEDFQFDLFGIDGSHEGKRDKGVVRRSAVFEDLRVQRGDLKTSLRFWSDQIQRNVEFHMKHRSVSGQAKRCG